MLNIVLVFHDILKSYLVSIYLLIYLWYNLLLLDILLPWQQKHPLITLLFEGIRTSYLLDTFLEATAISGISCCCGYLVTMTTRAGAYNIVFEGIRTSYLVHTFLEATAISGIDCYLGNRSRCL